MHVDVYQSTKAPGPYCSSGAMPVGSPPRRPSAQASSPAGS
jgi:hypothetical protein